MHTYAHKGIVSITVIAIAGCRSRQTASVCEPTPQRAIEGEACTLRGFSLRIDTIARSYDSIASCSARSCSSTVDDIAAAAAAATRARALALLVQFTLIVKKRVTFAQWCLANLTCYYMRSIVIKLSAQLF